MVYAVGKDRALDSDEEVAAADDVEEAADVDDVELAEEATSDDTEADELPASMSMELLDVMEPTLFCEEKTIGKAEQQQCDKRMHNKI